MSIMKQHTEQSTYHPYCNEIFDNSNDIIYLVEVTDDRRFIHLDINTAFHKGIGLPKEAIIGRYVDELENHAFRQILIQKYTSCLDAGAKTNFIGEYFEPSGVRTLHSVLTPIWDENGRIHRITGIARDISDSTKNIKIQKALLEREQLFRSLAENFPDNIMKLDTKGRCLYINPALERTLGKPASEVIGTLIPEDSIRFKAAIAQVIATQKNVYIQQKMPGENGATEIHDVILVPEYDETKQLVSILGIGRNNTLRYRMEDEIALQEEQYRTLVESLPDNILRYDRDCRTTYISPALERIGGREAVSFLMGKTPTQAHLMEDAHQAQEYQNKLAHTIATGTINEMDLTTSAQYGASAQTHHIRFVPERNPNGEIFGALVIGRDITEQRRLETELVSREYAFRSLAENTPDNIARWDTKGRYLYINPIHERTLNKSASEVIGTFIPDSHTAVRSAIAQIVVTGETITALETVPARDGSMGLEYHEVSITPERDASGKIVSILGIGRDITQRKRIEMALEKSEQTLQEAQHIAHLGSWDVDMVNDVLTWSDETYRMWEIDKERFAATFVAFLETVHPEDRKLVTNAYNDSILNHSIYDVEHRLLFPDGRIKYIHERGEPYYDAEGKPTRFIGVSLDVTDRKTMEEALKQSEQHYRTLIENSIDHIIRYDKKGQIVYINPQLEIVLQSKLADVMGKTPTELQPAGIYDEYEPILKRVIESGQNDSYILTFKNPQGETIYHHLNIIAERDHKGNLIGAITMGHDISELKRAEEKLKKNEARLQEAQKIAKVGSWELNFTTLTLTWSDEIYHIFEVQKTLQPSYELFLSLIHPDDRDNVDATYTDALNNKTSYDMIHRLLMSDGRIKYIHERGETTYDEEGNPLYTVGTAQDITQQKNVEKKIQHMAHHDALTGLPNRVLAKEGAEDIIAHAKRSHFKAAFLFIDLDGFKAINDTLGHSTGDLTLKTVASRLLTCIRERDRISRQGGDEFLIILSDMQESDSIASIAEKILKELEKSFEINTHILSLSGSIGIALYPDHGETFEILLKNADTAMYKAKETGKNGYHFYTQQMSHNLIGQFKIQNDLKSALQHNEFILFYQPQIDLAKNKITGVEALIRWRHPQQGMIPPMSFIPIAESSGMIVQIGQWVIEEACRQAALWHEQGIKICVAVNISAMQFKRGNLEDVVKNALISSQLDPKWLELELTESVMMHDAEKTLQSIRNLKALGVQLSIDDFGTGYSSLAYLKRFAVDKLKIDQSFIRDILHNQEDSVIVQTIIQMSKSLNLLTIAEGVENQEVSEVVKSFGCDEVQGYHFAKPMEASALEEFFISYA